jgi:acetyl-CoA acetyltransferase
VPRTARDVVFVDGARTPFGKAGPDGLYAETRADDMVVGVIRELLRRNPALPGGDGHRPVPDRHAPAGGSGGVGPPGGHSVRYGLTTMCVGLGMGGTVLWENIND